MKEEKLRATARHLPRKKKVVALAGMPKLALVFALCASTAWAVPRGGAKYVTDQGTVSFLRRHLVSGGEIQYPFEAARKKQQGSLLFLMNLRPDGGVESVTLKSATGDAVFADDLKRTLQGYRFKSGTEGPLVWLVSFLPPVTVMVKVSRHDRNARLFLPK